MAKEEEAKDEAEASGGGKKKLIIMIVPVIFISFLNSPVSIAYIIKFGKKGHTASLMEVCVYRQKKAVSVLFPFLM